MKFVHFRGLIQDVGDSFLRGIIADMLVFSYSYSEMNSRKDVYRRPVEIPQRIRDRNEEWYSVYMTFSGGNSNCSNWMPSKGSKSL